MFTSTLLSAAAAFILASTGVDATLNLNAKNNLALYWGQNYNGGNQQTLATYCANTAVDVIPIAFLTKLHSTGNYPEINLSNQCGGTTFSKTNLYSCPAAGADIITCQKKYGKKILLSIGGATYNEGGWKTAAAAVADATTVWNLFGNNLKNTTRPFGNAIVDGFDLDFERPPPYDPSARMPNVAAFAGQLRKLINADKSKTYLLTAAPQCPSPDYMQVAFQTVAFDALFIQFYNNHCAANTWTKGGNQNTPSAAFNLGYWQSWTQSSANANKNIKLFVGMLGAQVTGQWGYASAWRAGQLIADAKRFPNFAGAMLWSAALATSQPSYVTAVKTALNGSASKKGRGVVGVPKMEERSSPIVTRHHHHVRKATF